MTANGIAATDQVSNPTSTPDGAVPPPAAPLPEPSPADRARAEEQLTTWGFRYYHDGTIGVLICKACRHAVKNIRIHMRHHVLEGQLDVLREVEATNMLRSAIAQGFPNHQELPESAHVPTPIPTVMPIPDLETGHGYSCTAKDCHFVGFRRNDVIRHMQLDHQSLPYDDPLYSPRYSVLQYWNSVDHPFEVARGLLWYDPSMVRWPPDFNDEDADLEWVPNQVHTRTAEVRALSLLRRHGFAVIKEYKATVCVVCRVAVRATDDGLAQHLETSHKRLGTTASKFRAQEALSVIARYFPDTVAPESLDRPDPTSPPLPYLNIFSHGFACNGCNFASAQQSALHLHMKRKHLFDNATMRRCKEFQAWQRDGRGYRGYFQVNYQPDFSDVVKMRGPRYPGLQGEGSTTVEDDNPIDPRLRSTDSGPVWAGPSSQRPSSSSGAPFQLAVSAQASSSASSANQGNPNWARSPQPGQRNPPNVIPSTFVAQIHANRASSASSTQSTVASLDSQDRQLFRGLAPANAGASLLARAAAPRPSTPQSAQSRDTTTPVLGHPSQAQTPTATATPVSVQASSLIPPSPALSTASAPSAPNGNAVGAQVVDLPTPPARPASAVPSFPQVNAPANAATPAASTVARPSGITSSSAIVSLGLAAAPSRPSESASVAPSSATQLNGPIQATAATPTSVSSAVGATSTTSSPVPARLTTTVPLSLTGSVSPIVALALNPAGPLSLNARALRVIAAVTELAAAERPASTLSSFAGAPAGAASATTVPSRAPVASVAGTPTVVPSGTIAAATTPAVTQTAAVVSTPAQVASRPTTSAALSVPTAASTLAPAGQLAPTTVSAAVALAVPSMASVTPAIPSTAVAARVVPPRAAVTPANPPAALATPAVPSRATVASAVPSTAVAAPTLPARAVGAPAVPPRAAVTPARSSAAVATSAVPPRTTVASAIPPAAVTTPAVPPRTIVASAIPPAAVATPAAPPRTIVASAIPPAAVATSAVPPRAAVTPANPRAAVATSAVPPRAGVTSANPRASVATSAVPPRVAVTPADPRATVAAPAVPPRAAVITPANPPAAITTSAVPPRAAVAPANPPTAVAAPAVPSRAGVTPANPPAALAAPAVPSRAAVTPAQPPVAAAAPSVSSAPARALQPVATTTAASRANAQISSSAQQPRTILRNLAAQIMTSESEDDASDNLPLFQRVARRGALARPVSAIAAIRASNGPNTVAAATPAAAESNVATSTTPNPQNAIVAPKTPVVVIPPAAPAPITASTVFSIPRSTASTPTSTAPRPQEIRTEGNAATPNAIRQQPIATRMMPSVAPTARPRPLSAVIPSPAAKAVVFLEDEDEEMDEEPLEEEEPLFTPSEIAERLERLMARRSRSTGETLWQTESEGTSRFGALRLQGANSYAADVTLPEDWERSYSVLRVGAEVFDYQVQDADAAADAADGFEGDEQAMEVEDEIDQEQQEEERLEEQQQEQVEEEEQEQEDAGQEEEIEAEQPENAVAGTEALQPAQAAEAEETTSADSTPASARTSTLAPGSAPPRTRTRASAQASVPTVEPKKASGPGARSRSSRMADSIRSASLGLRNTRNGTSSRNREARAAVSPATRPSLKRKRGAAQQEDFLEDSTETETVEDDDDDDTYRGSHYARVRAAVSTISTRKRP
ncbi:hypothetical protein OC846_005695 [Tilletia horrida]|uniref:C2H2-type domain-containing protein n=1 Tax=Tilletia horrida TaxID=155126 RepID=A0AAN6GK06_9BASI|nr:hypothetical protein OC846_005695 [Tilletia horrida]KAK0547219.1 hypothetical protein OC845_004206 [Tilletia horrida]KAK0562652.1 hypothetical protein OC861_005214 [Tilletia horrida]